VSAAVEGAETARPQVAGVILAAGWGRRFGGEVSKVLRLLDGVPLVCRVAHAALAAQLAEVVVVVGHQATEVRAAVEGLPLRTVENTAWQDGQSTSVGAGLDALGDRIAAAVFLPADQPLLSPLSIDRILEAHGAGAEIVVSTWGGTRRAPVLFGRRFFTELRSLTGDTGGRALLPRYPKEVHEVPVPSALEVADVDDPQSLRELHEALVEIL